MLSPIVHRIMLWWAGITMNQWLKALEFVMTAYVQLKDKSGADRFAWVKEKLQEFAPNLSTNRINWLIETVVMHALKAK